ncbi:MAG: efflux RND transporter periplasmic adaptor subunit [Pirellulales bacterium]
MKLWWFLFTSLHLLGFLAVVAGCGQKSAADTAADGRVSGPRLERVVAGTPLRKTLRFSTSQPARIEAFEETPLHSKLAGYVDAVLVDIGDRVTKDQVLVRLWIPELAEEVRYKDALVEQASAAIAQAKAAVRTAESDVATKKSQIDEAEAGVARAEGDLARWKAELERITQLAAGESVTQKLVDETRNQFQSATANRAQAMAKVESARADLARTLALVEQAQADLSAAEAKLQVAVSDRERSRTLMQYAEIKAPYDGIVTERHVDTRHFVQPAGGPMAKPLVAVSQSNRVRVVVDVPENEAGFLNPGDQAVVRVQAIGKRDFAGAVTRDAWSLDAANRSLRAEIDLPNPDGVLRPGMYASVTILLAEAPDALVLPTTAILQTGGETYCMIVDAGVVKKCSIELGLRSGPEVAVKSGLAADEIVVVTRGESLAEGQPVEVIKTQ